MASMNTHRAEGTLSTHLSSIEKEIKIRPAIYGVSVKILRVFNYDNIDRLTSVTGGVSENYVFDGVGNQTSSHKSATYVYQPFNKLTSTATANYSYDANGNMLSKSDATGYWIYAWTTKTG